MQLSPRAFNRFLNQLGQSFSWRKGFACPCLNRASGQPDPSCTHCEGKGRLWDGPTLTGTAGVVSQTKFKHYEKFGPFDQDDMMLSIGSDSPLYPMGQFDRVQAMNRTEPFSQAMVRGLNDTIRFPIVSIDRAFYFDANNTLVDMAVPKVNPDGTLNWNGNPPPTTAQFSLTGRRAPLYFCYLEIPTDRPMHHGATLPRKVVLRRFELLDRSR